MNAYDAMTRALALRRASRESTAQLAVTQRGLERMAAARQAFVERLLGVPHVPTEAEWQDLGRPEDAR